MKGESFVGLIFVIVPIEKILPKKDFLLFKCRCCLNDSDFVIISCLLFILTSFLSALRSHYYVYFQS